MLGRWRRWKSLSRVLPLSLLIALGAGQASANQNADLLAAAFSGDTSKYETMSDEEMSETRGGLRSFAFGLFITGDITNIGGEVPDGIEVVSQTPDLVSLNVGLAGLADTGGLIQFASITGNNNIVNNNTILNIYILEDGVADTSSLFSGAFTGN